MPCVKVHVFGLSYYEYIMFDLEPRNYQGGQILKKKIAFNMNLSPS